MIYIGKREIVERIVHNLKPRADIELIVDDSNPSLTRAIGIHECKLDISTRIFLQPK